LLIQRELENLSRITNNPTKPVVAILGGAKVSDKLKVISNLLKIADKILICGGMAYTFLKAKGFDIGKSLLEQEMLQEAKRLLEVGKDKIVLPADYQCASEFADAVPKYHLVGDNIENLVVLDIGAKTVEIFNEVLESAGTVF
jgi:phosphoglycerate kinase